jgi:protein-tyrosine-phosphatase
MVMCPRVHTSAGGMRAQGDGMRVLALILAHLAPPPAQAATAFALALPQARPPPCCCWPPHGAAVSIHRGRGRQGKGVEPAALRCQEGTGGEDSSLTADSALEQWRRARQFHAQTLKYAVGTSRRHVSLLVVSNDCIRALLVEKFMQKLLPAFFAADDELAGSELGSSGGGVPAPKKSDRLLVLSAGLRNEPGAPVPVPLIAAAAERGIDLTDDNPRAAFDSEDLEYFDLILCVDRDVRDKVLEMAARRAGGSDRVADPDVFSGASFAEASSSASPSSLTRRLSYDEYEKKIILAGGDVEARAQGRLSMMHDKSDAIEIVALPGVRLLEASLVKKRLPQVLEQVADASYWTLELLARLGL